MVATADGRIVRRKKFKASEVPAALVHEIIDGKPLYRRGYRDVMEGKKQIEEVMGSGMLQSTLVEYLVLLLAERMDRKIFHMALNESGLHLERRSNLSNDIAIFEKSKLGRPHLKKGYYKVAPVVNIEIDTDIDFEDMSHETYVQLKTQKLLDFGSQRVVWFFTSSRKVLVAEPGKAWLTMPWDTEVELLEGIRANVGKFLEDEGLEIVD